MNYTLIFSILLLFTTVSCKGSINVEQQKETVDTKVYYTIFIWYKDSIKLREFERKATPFFQKYGIQLHRIINEISSIPADGETKMDTPDEIQLASANNGEALEQLFADADFQKLLPIREEGVKKMTIVTSNKQQIEAVDLEAEIFGVGIFYFEKGGEKKLRKFEAKAGKYFVQHDLKITHVLTSNAIMAGIGEEDIAMPDEVQFITVKTNEQLQGLFGNQGFLDLVPLRDETTQSLTFFLGKKLL